MVGGPLHKVDSPKVQEAFGDWQTSGTYDSDLRGAQTASELQAEFKCSAEASITLSADHNSLRTLKARLNARIGLRRWPFADVLIMKIRFWSRAAATNVRRNPERHSKPFAEPCAKRVSVCDASSRPQDA